MGVEAESFLSSEVGESRVESVVGQSFSRDTHAFWCIELNTNIARLINHQGTTIDQFTLPVVAAVAGASAGMVRWSITGDRHTCYFCGNSFGISGGFRRANSFRKQWAKQNGVWGEIKEEYEEWVDENSNFFGLSYQLFYIGGDSEVCYLATQDVESGYTGNEDGVQQPVECKQCMPGSWSLIQNYVDVPKGTICIDGDTKKAWTNDFLRNGNILRNAADFAELEFINGGIPGGGPGLIGGSSYAYIKRWDIGPVRQVDIWRIDPRLDTPDPSVKIKTLTLTFDLENKNNRYPFCGGK